MIITSRCGAFFAGFFLILGGGFMGVVIAVVPAMDVMSAEQWHEMPCVILSSEVKRLESISEYEVEGRRQFSFGDIKTTLAAIEFEYEVEGRAYKSNRHSCEGLIGFSSRRLAENRVKRYPAGSEQVCYVNPANPAEAVLDRSLPDSVVLGLMGLGLLIMGLHFLYGGLQTKTPRAPDLTTDGAVVLEAKESHISIAMSFGFLMIFGSVGVFLLLRGGLFIGFLLSLFSSLIALGLAHTIVSRLRNVGKWGR